MSMALARQGDNSTPTDFKKMFDYCTDETKTRNKEFVFSYGCLTDDPMSEMMAQKKIYGKITGRQYTHIIVNATPVNNDLTDDEFLELGKEIGRYYFDLGYQCIVTVHFDTGKRHIHLIINSVSYQNGKKFSQSISQLNRFKVHCNRVLAKYGLNIIKTSAEKIRDNKKYSFAKGYDFLESYDEIEKDIAISFCDDIDPVGMVNNVPSKSKYDPDAPKGGYNHFFAEQSETYRDYYVPKEITGYPKIDLSKAWAPEKELAPMAEFDSANILPVIRITEKSHESCNGYNPTEKSPQPGMLIKAGRTVDIAIPLAVDIKDIQSVINHITPSSPKEKHDAIREATTAKVAMDNFGDETEVTVDIQDHINIHYENDQTESINDTISLQDTSSLSLPSPNTECMTDAISAPAEASSPKKEFSFAALAKYSEYFPSTPASNSSNTNYKSIADDAPVTVESSGSQRGFSFAALVNYSESFPSTPASNSSNTNYKSIADDTQAAAESSGSQMEFSLRALANYNGK